MPNLHTPERGDNESQAQYRERQAASRAAVRRMVKGPTQAPHIQIPGGPLPNWVLFWLGQHTNPLASTRRFDKSLIGARQFRKTTKARKAAARKQLAEGQAS